MSEQVAATIQVKTTKQPKDTKEDKEKSSKSQQEGQQTEKKRSGEEKKSRGGNKNKNKQKKDKKSKKAGTTEVKYDLGAPVFVPSFGVPVQQNASPNVLAPIVVPTPPINLQSPVQPLENFNLSAPAFVFKKPSSGSSGPPPQIINQQTTFSLSQFAGQSPPLINVSPVPQIGTYQTSPPQGIPSFVSQLGADPMNGYKNPFLNKQGSQPAKTPISSVNTTPAHGQDSNRGQQDSPQSSQQNSKIYTIDFMLSLCAGNRDRPANMALLDFPSKNRKRKLAATNGGKGQMSEKDKFNSTVRELRVLLNKLSKDNFDNVSRKICNDFNFTPSLLNELMKIIFMKATTESTYLEIYVRLCIQLFKKYNDKENKEMNFRKLLLMKCQKQFYKLLAREEQERRTRRESMDSQQSASQSSSKLSLKDFNKQMLYVFDSEEIKYRQKLQLFGNMSLLVELYIQKEIPESIIKTCVENLLDDINDQTGEILCQMLQKIASHVVKRAIVESKEVIDKSKSNRKTLASCLINLDFIEKCLSKLFPYRTKKELLSSRVRFKIQDLIDEYEKDWKSVIYGERRMVDEEGFHYKYVPKEQIQIITDELKNSGKKVVSKRKGSNVDAMSTKALSQKSKTKAYVYVQKNSQAAANQSAQPSHPTAEGGVVDEALKLSQLEHYINKLAPEGDDLSEGEAEEYENEIGDIDEEDNENSDDDDEVSRKYFQSIKSLNQQNATGTNFEKYNREKNKPTHEARRKIANFVLEYRDMKDREHAKNSLLDICQETKVEKYQFIGYILNNAFSFEESGWKEMVDLILEHFYAQEKLLTCKDLVEGLNVSLANFSDTLIDYPMSRDYAFNLIERLGAVEVLAPEMMQKYKQHIQNLENFGEDDQTSAKASDIQAAV